MGQSASTVRPPDVHSKNNKNNNDDVSDEDEKSFFPEPTGKEYEEIDKLQSELPSMIDEESRQQVDDYVEACNNGKGPMVACFATGEYLSMFERKVSVDCVFLYVCVFF